MLPKIKGKLLMRAPSIPPAERVGTYRRLLLCLCAHGDKKHPFFALHISQRPIKAATQPHTATPGKTEARISTMYSTGQTQSDPSNSPQASYENQRKGTPLMFQ
eukprot:scaffold126101_cov53-Prasinocladus_malaysianus.AAC.1